MSNDRDEEKRRRVYAYERMLERLNELMRSSEPQGLKEALDGVKKRAVELGELTREEAENISDFVRRDIQDAAQYVASSDKDYRTWLQMDLQLIENWIWDRFTSVADQTKVELLQFQEAANMPEEYHTGEIAGPGSLSCLNCGKEIHFSQTGHIPPCPSCHHSRFIRTARKAPDS
ncbi:hypothetical protein CAI21_06535 [Alkalilimnicola ehrlichii]|uniref:Zinc ribbon-containing protein n=1 Tax=Alkalilimnicola ehrlichii TaxID=351052 RepID=A0A3E0WYG3_9GAMM|nr:zinc ribbon-containing protein [Alkalilimnicola ehrlichii]RFA30269.1 hypothetical protein CAI21_06535 [Alkalilimnicola ehrlichii]RFA37848.1 hypothetical protein CAL65_07885 [Alkalilimnicola ehrlichii]